MNLLLIIGSLAVSLFAAIYYALWLGRKNLPDNSTKNAVPAPSVIAAENLMAFNTYEPPHMDTHLDIFCGAIKDYEGGPNDANHKNNNPGNARFNKGGYLPKYGTVRRSPSGFAIFPTWAQGWAYLEAMVSQMAKKHPTWTFVDFFSHYAPTEDDNEPIAYAKFVAKRCGVVVDKTVASYLG